VGWPRAFGTTSGSRNVRTGMSIICALTANSWPSGSPPGRAAGNMLGHDASPACPPRRRPSPGLAPPTAPAPRTSSGFTRSRAARSLGRGRRRTPRAH
jgi:hypothetical protein